MTLSKKKSPIRAAVILAICVCLFAGCSNQSTGNFRPTYIACRDHSSSEDILGMKEAWGENEYGGPLRKYISDPEHIKPADLDAFFNPMLEADKRAAEKGNIFGISQFGILKREKLIALYIFEKGWAYMPQKNLPSETLPPYMKLHMVEALSYIYIADSLKHEDVDYIDDLIHSVENPGSEKTRSIASTVFITPPAWIAEAKANAARWKAHCRYNH